MVDNPTVPSTTAFDDAGFQGLPRPLPAGAVAAAAEALAGLAADRAARRLARASLHTAASGVERLVLPRPVPAVLALARDPALLGSARAVLRTDEPVIWGAELLTKSSAGPGGAIGWHQDQPYFHWWEGPTATAWIALTDMVPDCGSVRYVVGSHRWGDRHDTADFDRTPEETRREGPPPGQRWTEVEIVGPAGTAVLHHPGVVHGSGPNRTDRPRRALAVRLRASATTLRADTPASVARLLGDDRLWS
jgi:2-oxoglutarate-dependent dioxygenase